MAKRKIRARDVFETFLLKYHQEEIKNILKEEDDQAHYSVEINFLTLSEEYVEVAEAILSSPTKMLAIFDSALVRALTQIYDREKESDTQICLKLKVHIRLTGLPKFPELYRHAVPHANDVGRILCISGTVVRTVSPKMLEYQREYTCLKCKHCFVVKADYALHYEFTKPLKCPNPVNCYSTNFYLNDSLQKFSHTKDYQEIKIQEQAQKLLVGTIPRSIWVTLEDDLVDTVKPGDDALVCGVVLQRWKSISKGSRPTIDLVIKSNNITVHNKQRTGNFMTNELKAEFKKFWEGFQHDPLSGRNCILSSFCPQVYGLYVVKLAVAIVMAGGTQKVDINGTRTRGESHLLLVGDPGTGKSQFLKYVSSLVPRCVLTTGIGTTSAGLTVAAVREEGEWALEAGALVLADGGVCCIDEFNSIREVDRAAIHEAMEQQTISVAKAGIVCKLNTRCSILAATNPKGRYDAEESLTVNIALASPLLSRFDIILVLLDSRNAEWDRIVSTYILEGRDPLSSASKDSDNLLWGLEHLRAYFCYVRTLQPQMTTNAHSILTKYFQLQRQTDGRNQARTTIRLLESLVRLSQGHAKLMMREEVSTSDAVAAVCLMEASMCGTSLIKGGNTLHTAFPSSPKEEYRKQATLILSTLGLTDILSQETNRLNQSDLFHSKRTETAPQPSLARSKTEEKTQLTSAAQSKALKRGLAQTQDTRHLLNILELNESFIDESELREESGLVGKRGRRKKVRKRLRKSLGSEDRSDTVENGDQAFVSEMDFDLSFSGVVNDEGRSGDRLRSLEEREDSPKIPRKYSKLSDLKGWRVDKDGDGEKPRKDKHQKNNEDHKHNKENQNQDKNIENKINTEDKTPNKANGSKSSQRDNVGGDGDCASVEKRPRADRGEELVTEIRESIASGSGFDFSMEKLSQDIFDFEDFDDVSIKSQKRLNPSPKIMAKSKRKKEVSSSPQIIPKLGKARGKRKVVKELSTSAGDISVNETLLMESVEDVEKEKDECSESGEGKENFQHNTSINGAYDTKKKLNLDRFVYTKNSSKSFKHSDAKSSTPEDANDLNIFENPQTPSPVLQRRGSKYSFLDKLQKFSFKNGSNQTQSILNEERSQNSAPEDKSNVLDCSPIVPLPSIKSQLGNDSSQSLSCYNSQYSQKSIDKDKITSIFDHIDEEIDFDF